jgi:hypothetical protein
VNDLLRARLPYGFFVAVGFGGGGGIFMFVLAGAVFAGLGVAGAIVGAGLVVLALFAFSFVDELQPTASAPRANDAISAAVLNLVMKSPLLVSDYRLLESNGFSMFVKRSEVSGNDGRP